MWNGYITINFYDNKSDQNQALEKLAFLMMPDLEHRESSANARFFNDEGRKILTVSLIALYHIKFKKVQNQKSWSPAQKILCYTINCEKVKTDNIE